MTNHQIRQENRLTARSTLIELKEREIKAGIIESIDLSIDEHLEILESVDDSLMIEYLIDNFK